MRPEDEIRAAAKQLFERKFLPAAERPEASRRIEAELDTKIASVGERHVRYREQLLQLVGQAKALWNRRGELDRKQVALLAAALLYFLSPLDLIPDVVPGLGYVDDFFVLAYVLKTIASTLRPLGTAFIDEATGALAEKGRKALEDVVDSRLADLDRVSTAAVRRSIGIVAISLWGTTTAAAVSVAVIALTGTYAVEWGMYMGITAALVGFWNVSTAVAYWRQFRQLHGTSQQRLIALVASRTRKRDVAAVVVPLLLILGLVVVRFILLR